MNFPLDAGDDLCYKPAHHLSPERPNPMSLRIHAAKIEQKTHETLCEACDKHLKVGDMAFETASGKVFCSVNCAEARARIERLP